MDTMNGHGTPSMHLDQTILMLSGIVVVNLRALGLSEESAKANTNQEDLTLDLSVPIDFLATGQSFKITQAVPYIGLNSLSRSAHTSWGVNNFSVDTEKSVIESMIRLEDKLDVSRSGEVLQRIAYQVTILGMASN